MVTFPLFVTQRGRLGVLGFLALLLSGVLTACVPTLLYRHADRLVTWKVDRYLDLRSEQKQFLRTRLREVLEWHRREALPAYAAFLATVKEKSGDGLTSQEVEWAFERYETLKRALFERVTDDATRLLTSMSGAQVQHLERVFRAEREEAERLLQMPLDTRLARRTRETVRWVKEWVGALTPEQTQAIVELSRRLPDMAPVWIDYGQQRREQFLETLRATRDPLRLTTSLTTLLLAEDNPPEKYQPLMEQGRRAVQTMILDIDQLLTIQQRQHALRKIQDLIDEIRALATT